MRLLIDQRPRQYLPVVHSPHHKNVGSIPLPNNRSYIVTSILYIACSAAERPAIIDELIVSSCAAPEKIALATNTMIVFSPSITVALRQQIRINELLEQSWRTFLCRTPPKISKSLV